MILSVYDISKAVGPDGKPVEPDGECTSGTLRYVYSFNLKVCVNAMVVMSIILSSISHPKPFKYSITPRSEKAEMLIRSLD